METFQKIVLFFTIVGALNWGLIGFFNFNLVDALFKDNTITNIIYAIVGLCGLINVGIFFSHFKENEE